MKKTIILIALALLLIVPVFAGTPLTKVEDANGKTLDTTGVFTNSSADPKDTTVKIELKQFPIYMVAITNAAYSTSGSKISHYTESGATKYNAVAHVTDIEMEVDNNTWTLKDKTGYYVTYYAYENNQNVEYIIKLNGNMVLTSDVTVPSTDTENPQYSNKQKEIRYIMCIAGIKGDGTEDASSTVTLYSDGSSDNTTIVRKVASTLLIGKSEYKSYALTLKAYTKDNKTDTVQYNIVGKYEGTVTLTIKSYA